MSYLARSTMEKVAGIPIPVPLPSGNIGDGIQRTLKDSGLSGPAAAAATAGLVGGGAGSALGALAPSTQGITKGKLKRFRGAGKGALAAALLSAGLTGAVNAVG